MRNKINENLYFGWNNNSIHIVIFPLFFFYPACFNNTINGDLSSCKPKYLPPDCCKCDTRRYYEPDCEGKSHDCTFPNLNFCTKDACMMKLIHMQAFFTEI